LKNYKNLISRTFVTAYLISDFSLILFLQTIFTHPLKMVHAARVKTLLNIRLNNLWILLQSALRVLPQMNAILDKSLISSMLTLQETRARLQLKSKTSKKDIESRLERTKKKLSECKTTLRDLKMLSKKQTLKSPTAKST